MSIGTPLKNCIQTLHTLAPLELAEDWDNVGLLVQPSKNPPITRIVLCIDLNEAVAREALRMKCDLIVAYHPPIFDPLKRLSIVDRKTRHLIELLNRGVSVYSPHTALDAIQGGVNDWLADGLGAGARAPIHSHENNALIGSGRLVRLDKAVSLNTLIKRIKSHLGLPTLRVAKTDNKKLVRTIALCAGAGASVLRGCKADVYWTGEMRHHDVLNAVAYGHHVILSEHTHTERGYLPTLQKALKKALGTGVQVKISKKDADPLVSL